MGHMIPEGYLPICTYNPQHGYEVQFISDDVGDDQVDEAGDEVGKACLYERAFTYYSQPGIRTWLDGWVGDWGRVFYLNFEF